MKTAIGGASPSAGEIENLFGGHPHAPLTAKLLNDAAAPSAAGELPDEDTTVSALGKLHFAARHQSGAFPQLLGDRYLALGSDLHRAFPWKSYADQ